MISTENLERPLNSPYDFDLSRHGWIEASAGTGKTFTIERLVVRAIVEEQTPVSSILAVTFTEKATGELKDRIRKILQSIVDGTLNEADKKWLKKYQGSAITQSVQESLDRFDEAAIFTIHGFCHSLLQEYSFELGRLLRYELVNDNDLLDTLIADVLRRLPASQADLQEKLVQAEFWAVDYNRPHRLENRVRELVKKLKGKTKLQFSDDSPAEIVRFMVTTIQENLKRIKAENGWITYDDMILHVRNALIRTDDEARPSKSASLASHIAGRFRFAIIDEFQDTDRHQWEIFQTCFLSQDKHHGEAERKINASPSRLILVGDPKQSIYRFRGADLNAYFEAKKCFVALAEKNQANLYRINRNFRSSTQYIEALNRIFQFEGYPWNNPESSGSDNPSDDMNLNYTPAESPQSNRWVGTQLPAKRYAVNLWKPAEDKPAASRLRREYARFICNEIHYLIKGKLCENGKTREVNYDDICILSRSKKDALTILKHLRREKIPASFYKQQGVFESVEALEILYVLEALAQPSVSSVLKRALLTRFFGVPLSQLQDSDELTVNDTLRERLQRWHELAGDNRWPQLFREMMSVDGLYERLRESSYGWERSLTNYEQILHTLEERAYRNELDLTGMVRQLKELIREGSRAGSVEEEETLHRQETEEKRVRVMTIHASKGLEFPIVFIYGGLTAGNTTDVYEFYENGHPVIVPCFKSDGLLSEKHKSFARTEDARLYYVALTRAAVMCYVPFHSPQRNRGFVGEYLYKTLDSVKKENLIAVIDSSSHPSPSQSTAQSASAHTGNMILPEPELPEYLQERKAELLSYSSIVRLLSRQINHEERDYDDSYDNTIENTGETSNPETDPLSTIFQGTRSGNFFHAILERLDYQDSAFQEDELSGGDYPPLSSSNQFLIKARLKDFGFPDHSDYTAPVERLLHRLMRTEILPGFYLRNLRQEDRIHEMEFVFQNSERVPGKKGEIFLRGFIDLVFRYQGQIYLLDWKTNRLEGYDQTNLNEAIKDHRYDLQYLLYTRAVCGWLEHRGHDPLKEFGGVIYLFLRGISPKTKNGIFFRRINYEDVRARINQEIEA
jgi:exodeoxyribonuclease V beta subunit